MRRVSELGLGTVLQRDLLIVALARYVEALHARYPEGPD